MQKMEDKYKQIDKCIQKWLTDNNRIAIQLNIIGTILVDKGFYNSIEQCYNDITGMSEEKCGHLLNANKINDNEILFINRKV